MDTQTPARLVAFTGPAGVGKSEAADFLIENYGFVRVKFADPLKAMLTTLYEFAGVDADAIRERIEGGLKEEPDGILRGRSPRYAMQTLGGEWGRDIIDRNLWLAIWRRSVFRKLDAGISVVVDDLRYFNEAEMVKQLEGDIVQLSGTARRQVAAHQSEQVKLPYDYQVKNNATLPVLWQRLIDTLHLS